MSSESTPYQSLCYDGYDPKWILGKPLENLEIPPAPAEPDPAPPDPATDVKKEDSEEKTESAAEEKKEEDAKSEDNLEKKDEQTEGEEKKEDGDVDKGQEEKKEETKKEEPPAPPSPPDPVKLKVPFCCEACEEKVRAVFRVMSGVESFIVDSESGLVTITGNVQMEECLNLAKKVARRAEIL